MTLPEAHKFFYETFGIHLGGKRGYLDGAMTLVSGRPVIDMQKFEDWLRKKHRDYENTRLSMRDILIENYGESVAGRIKELL